MNQKIWAFIAFNVYSLFLLSAFQENTAYIFDQSLLVEARLDGFDIDPGDLGWGSHYIWRLFSGLVVTALAGFLAGAVAKRQGSQVALTANIPSVLVWCTMIYLFGFAGIEVEARTGYIIISILAIPLTTYIAYCSGGFGENVQRDSFPENTVLGIKAYHFAWIVIPLYFYSLGIIFSSSKFLLVLFTANALTVFPLVALAIPVIAWIYPLILVYRLLVDSSRYSATRSVLQIIGILVIGSIVALAIQVIIYWFFVIIWT